MQVWCVLHVQNAPDGDGLFNDTRRAVCNCVIYVCQSWVSDDVGPLSVWQ